MAKSQGQYGAWQAAILALWIVAANIWYFFQFKSELLAALRTFAGRSWR
jgi:hypothetical protein